MKFLQIIFLLLPFSTIQAQVEDLMKNDSITWIAEWYADYLLDDFDARDSISNNSLGIIKYLNRDDYDFKENRYFLSERLWKAVEKNEIKVYSDLNLTKILSKDVAFSDLKHRHGSKEDSLNYETRDCMSYKWSSIDVQFYRVRQIIYYLPSKAQFQIKILAIAPLVDNLVADIVYKEPLFWFKPEMNLPNISSDDIIWAQKLQTKTSSLDFSKAKILKNAMTDSIIHHFVNSFENKTTIPFWGESQVGNTLELLTPTQRKTHLHPIESWTTLESGREPITINKEFKIQRIKHLRLFQEWFWDERLKQLSMHLSKVALMYPIENEDGSLLYHRPIFFRKTDD